MNMLVSTAIAGTAVPAVAAEINDPIFAAIEAHKATRTGLTAAVDRHAQFERELQVNGRLETAKRLEDERRQGEEIEAAIDLAYDAETDAACVLVSDLPTTMAGVLALLRYAVDADTDGEMWPGELLSDDGSKTRSWHHFPIANLIEILPELMAGAA
jgi:hypothetical protein